MDSKIIFLFAAVLIIAGILIAAISMTKKGTRTLDVDKYRKRFLAIERQLNKTEPLSYQLVVLNADKLLDAALKERGVKGETMGERMKSAQDIWSNRNNVWSAHKLRNNIAHEADVKISYDDARRALAAFRTALKDVGAV